MLLTCVGVVIPGVEKGNRIVDPIWASFREQVFARIEVQMSALEKFIQLLRSPAVLHRVDHREDL
jgi:hypothetical protein